AQNPLTPWKTIKRALSTAVGGDTIIVQPGTYNETVSSKKDGSSGAVITLRSATPGAAIIQPPTGGMGFYILHNYHVTDGSTVTQATVGVRAGPHLSNNTDPIAGILIENMQIYGNSSNGVQFNNGFGGEVAFNVIYGNAANGVNYDGNSSLIHDNV